MKVGIPMLEKGQDQLPKKVTTTATTTSSSQ
jgi:hypothetical protein